jgi:hypothetical protein
MMSLGFDIPICPHEWLHDRQPRLFRGRDNQSVQRKVESHYFSLQGN